MAKSQPYDEFVDKFKPKLTTDDCYTPPLVYEAVLMQCRDNIDMGGGEAVILEIPSHTPEYYETLAEARRKYNGRIFFYFSDDMELKEIKK